MMAALGVLMGVAGCGSDRPPGALGYVEGFSGAVVADEPRAVLVARDILSAGGTAADAATAMAFALAVTLPTSASLGGGGICLVQDRDANDALRVEALDFLPAAAAGPPGPDGAMTVPALPRGLFALHARDGVLRWETVVSPAETLARQGFTVSRALARQAQALGGLPPDSSISRVFGVAAPREGQRVQALDLARSLGQARVAPGGFHTGDMARQIVAAASEIGYTVTVDALRTWTPTWRPAIRHPHNPHWDLFAPVPDSAAGVAAQWAGQGASNGLIPGTRGRQIAAVRPRNGAVPDPGVQLAQGADEEGGAANVYPNLSDSPDSRAAPADPAPEPTPEPTPAMRDTADDDSRSGAAPAATRTIDETPEPATTPDATTPPEPAFAASPMAPGATGFVVVDSYGGAVACTLTTNRAFGIGRLLPGLGFAPVPLPGPEAPDLALMLRGNTNIKASLGGFAAVGPDATAAAVAAGTAVFLTDRALAPALADMARSPAAGRARLNMVSCPDAVPSDPDSCAVAVDPRGAGLGMIFGKQ